jgi:DNA polymerase, archaea type
LAFDLEWSLNKDENDEYPILAAGFYDNDGFSKVLLIEDYGENRKAAEKALLFNILNIIEKYDWSLGFYSTGIRAFNPTRHKIMGRDSDLIQLHRRLLRYNLDSPIMINELNHLPYLMGKNRDHTHLDAYNLFVNKVIKSSVYNNSYNSNDLDTISRAILGDKEGGKYDGLSGLFESLSKLEDKRAYVLKDAQLLMQCVAHNNYELLNVMHSLSELTGIPFKNVCYSKGVTKIWTPIIDKLTEQEINSIEGGGTTDDEILRCQLLLTFFDRKKDFNSSDNESESTEEKFDFPDSKTIRIPRYIGGWVMAPKPGEYKDVSVFDITSLYPMMIVNNNISFETVNCKCCKDVKSVPKLLFESGKTKRDLHICVKHPGILTRQILAYMNKRIEYKRLAKTSDNDRDRRQFEILSNAYKILINSVYGQMGHKFAKYENVLAAELVTRFGRVTIQKCAKIAKKLMKWDIIYGDTDSLFINNSKSISSKDIQKFKLACKEQCNIDMELDKIYSKFLITGAKNYVGITDSDKLVVKGLAGKKSDRCMWVRNAFKRMLEDYKNGVNPCHNLAIEIAKLQSRKLEHAEHQLIISKQLSMNTNEYKVNVIQKIIGEIKNLEAGDTVRYYMADKPMKFTENVRQASITEYKKQLINTVKPILNLLKYDLKKELDDDLIKSTDNSGLVESSSDEPDEEIPIIALNDKPKNQKLIARSASQEIVQLDKIGKLSWCCT